MQEVITDDIPLTVHGISGAWKNSEERQSTGSSLDGRVDSLLSSESGIEDEIRHGQTVELERTLGLWSGMAMVIGTMIGSGIFSTTSLILQAVGSVGMSMGVWILGAVVSVCVCIAYVELGTMLPRSGGEKEYLDAAFRRPRALMPFLFCLSSIVICSPSGLAADAVVTGTYFLYAATGRAIEHSEWAQRIIGVSVAILCAVLHGFFVRFAIRVQSALTIVKLVLLLLIVVVGVCSWIKGNGAPNAGFYNAFQGTSVHPSAYLSALFKVMFAYSGFNVLNYSIDELKNPVRNLPRAALGGLFVTTVLYVASNAAYFLVLDPETIRRSSTAVAGVFFTNTLGDVWGQRIVPVLIGLATLGNIMCGVFAASRLVFEAAREGYLPGSRVLGEISRFQSPLAALAVTCWITVLFIVTPPAGEAYAFLIDIGVYPLWLFQGVAVIGLLVMRRTHRDLLRPFKAWQIANVVTLACAAFMLVFAFVEPSEDSAGASGSIPYWAAPLTALAFIALTCGFWYIQIVCRRGLERSHYRGKQAGFE